MVVSSVLAWLILYGGVMYGGVVYGGAHATIEEDTTKSHNIIPHTTKPPYCTPL